MHDKLHRFTAFFALFVSFVSNIHSQELPECGSQMDSSIRFSNVAPALGLAGFCQAQARNICQDDAPISPSEQLV